MPPSRNDEAQQQGRMLLQELDDKSIVRMGDVYGNLIM